MKLDAYEIDTLAELCHEANRVYCESLGDNSQTRWNAAPNWQKDSAHDGVTFIESGGTAEQAHENWCGQKAADGWVYGNVKDAEHKTHPCMVSYDHLPAEQKVKDHLFRSIVLAILALREKYREPDNVR